MGYLLKTNWWKWFCMILLVYTVTGGLLLPVPRLPILNETIRALHFHVPMWFGMILVFTGSVIYAIKYLKSGNTTFDTYSFQLANLGIVFVVLGIITGMIWAKFTWGKRTSRLRSAWLSGFQKTLREPNARFARLKSSMRAA